MAFTEETRLLWADFPADEYSARVERAQGLMAAEGLDVVVLTQKENVEYFSGFLTGHWASKSFPTAAVVLHRTKAPILVIPRFFAGTAWSTCWIDNIHFFEEPHAAPREFADVLIAAVREAGGKDARIGFERGQNLQPLWNTDDYIKVMAELVGGGEILSAANVVWGCRTIKSEREIERMKWLTGVTDRAILAMFRDLHLGETEIEVGNQLAKEMIDGGAEDTSFRNIRAGGNRYHCSDSHPQNRAFIENDLLVIDTGALFNGYVTDVAYTVLFGKPTARHEEVWDVVVRAQDAAIALCRPGVRACDVFFASEAIIKESGLPTLDMIGHTLGLDLHEPPMLTPYCTDPLKAGMILSVEPWLYDPTGLGVFAVEEHILVTEDGPVNLSSIERNELRTVR
ncbi:MAG: Xaa-Pro peptidase family protein [Bifidobacteriaceae bacterium]|jgi:Xaa-Pro aminopeptidase|nr:Xaa-Pro peptidase family protein [Bifidobacteriaceae bacterium]